MWKFGEVPLLNTELRFNKGARMIHVFDIPILGSVERILKELFFQMSTSVQYENSEKMTF